ncbi:GFA domain-containing protein [Mycena kentingensis (nom. inval.)]|nr:GFA domain-containing protein [Mycena kentingensis (nom. inval.)]
MAELVEYKGNCHCGAFKFAFKSPKITKASVCDCSMCSRNGYIFATPESFTVFKGDEDTTLTSYGFGKGVLKHKFCPHCGTSLLARFGAEMGGKVIVNLRAVQDIDFQALTIGEPFKGSLHGDPYVPPVPVPVEAGAANVYQGNCHCGAVSFGLVTPEKIAEASECNCSICWRDGSLWIYPPTKDLTIRGDENIVRYGLASFEEKFTLHCFCKTCGVSIFEQFNGLEPQLRDGPEYYGKPRNLWTAVNVRTINDFDVNAIKIDKVDRSKQLPLYVVPE